MFGLALANETEATLPSKLEPVLKKMRANATALSIVKSVPDLKAALAEAGFTEVRIDVKPGSREFIRDWMPGSGSEDYIASAAIEAIKPNGKSCCGPTCCAT